MLLIPPPPNELCSYGQAVCIVVYGDDHYGVAREVEELRKTQHRRSHGECRPVDRHLRRAQRRCNDWQRGEYERVTAIERGVDLLREDSAGVASTQIADRCDAPTCLEPLANARLVVGRSGLESVRVPERGLGKRG